MPEPLHPSSAAYRTYHRARPPDPIWATACVEACRKALREFDRDLDLWWSETSECWRIMQFYYSCNEWVEQLKWCSPEGDSRPLDAPGALVKAMQAIARPHDEVDRECQEFNEKLDQKRYEDSVDLQTQVAAERPQIASRMDTHNRTPRGKSPITLIRIDPEYIKVARQRGNLRYGPGP